MDNRQSPRAEVVVFPDTNALSRDAAYRFAAMAGAQAKKGERFSVALAGGRTPAQLYSLLASPALEALLDRKLVHLFFGDDRCVPPDSEFSNYRMAKETLFDPLSIPAENIHRIRGEDQDKEAAAQEYEQTLRDFFGAALPRFDLVLLGMGPDGHCASLFPHKPALKETQKWVVASEPGLKPFVSRITLTVPALNSAANILFLVGGEDKAERLKQVLEGPEQFDLLPSQSVRPTDGSLTWLVDRAAARSLTL